MKLIDKINEELKNEIYHDRYDCFFELINSLDIDFLDNLIELMQERINLSKDECYKILQNKNTLKELKIKVFDLAYECIDNHKSLGSGVSEYKFSKSSFISHSLEEARLCSLMAKKANLDTDKAFKMGLLHDYGRKYDHGGLHITLGFKELFSLGYITESIGCLTHSFLNDNYFACYNPTDEYKVNDDLNIIYIKESVKENEVYKFLSTYAYTDYDRILNLADLMTSANGVITPEKRIIDIEKRRKMTGNQRKFFIKELSETIYWYLKKINIPDELISLNNFESLSNLLYKSIYSKEDVLRLIKK